MTIPGDVANEMQQMALSSGRLAIITSLKCHQLEVHSTLTKIETLHVNSKDQKCDATIVFLFPRPLVPCFFLQASSCPKTRQLSQYVPENSKIGVRLAHGELIGQNRGK
jgi:hypothetical protein